MIGSIYDSTNGNSAGAAYVFQRIPAGTDDWIEMAKLLASDGTEMDALGSTVAVDGDTVVVGAYLDGAAALQAGSAYVFERNHDGPDAWGQVKKLLASDAGEYDAFGYSVSISGDTIAVSAVFDGAFGTGTGSAYLFERNQGGDDNWGEIKKIHTTSATQDYFGQSVSIHLDTLAVGAYHDDQIDTQAGAAYLFGRNQDGDGNWGEITKLLAGDGAGGDLFGSSVSVSGDTVVVGAPGDSDNGSMSGSAYQFERNQGGSDNWGEVAKLLAGDGEDGDVFGSSVSIDGDFTSIGSRWGSTGAAYLFQPDPAGSGDSLQALKLSKSVNFGFSVSVSGNTLAVTAQGDTNENGSGAGAVFVYLITE